VRRVVLCAIAVVAACAPTAGAAGKAETRVTLDNIEITPGGTIYTGDIFSTEKECKNRRRVFVYRAIPEAPDEKRGSTLSYKGTAQPGYYWAYEEKGVPPPGDYYAKVRPTDQCQGDRSPKYSLLD
jgi:hypothetical protein